MRNICIWTLVTLCGVGLIFNGQIRNDYYTAFSYLFPVNIKQYQDLADITRLILGLAMTLSFLNIFSGILFKLISMIGFVVYSVVINQNFIINPSIQNKQETLNLIIYLTLIFLCMDSLINQIIRQQNHDQRQKSQKIIESAKKQAQQVVEESKKNKNQKSNVSGGKNKNTEEIKTEKKQAKGQQKHKKI